MQKATIEMENGKKMVIELCEEHAPETVANFVKLARISFYDGLIFTASSARLAIQGVNLDRHGSRRAGVSDPRRIRLQRRPEPAETPARRDLDGAVGASGFRFAVFHHAQRRAAPTGNTLFGRMTDGFDALDEIAAAETDYSDRPRPSRRSCVTIEGVKKHGRG